MSNIENLKFTTKEVVYVISVCSAFIFNWYSLKLEIQELKIGKLSQDKITEIKLSSLSEQVADLRRDCDKIMQLLPSAYAIKPKDISLESETEKR